MDKGYAVFASAIGLVAVVSGGYGMKVLWDNAGSKHHAHSPATTQSTSRIATTQPYCPATLPTSSTTLPVIITPSTRTSFPVTLPTTTYSVPEKVKGPTTTENFPSYLTQPQPSSRPSKQKLIQILTSPEDLAAFQLASSRSFNLPVFPIGYSVMEGNNQSSVVSSEYMPQNGLALIESKSSLEFIASQIAKSYQPEVVDAQAFEKLSYQAGISEKLVRSIEPTTSPTDFDTLAQFIFAYNKSFTDNDGLEGIVSYNLGGKSVYVGNTDDLNSLKQRRVRSRK
jgi:hypothetical protein